MSWRLLLKISLIELHKLLIHKFPAVKLFVLYTASISPPTLMITSTPPTLCYNPYWYKLLSLFPIICPSFNLPCPNNNIFAINGNEGRTMNYKLIGESNLHKSRCSPLSLRHAYGNTCNVAHTIMELYSRHNLLIPSFYGTSCKVLFFWKLFQLNHISYRVCILTLQSLKSIPSVFVTRFYTIFILKTPF